MQVRGSGNNGSGSNSSSNKASSRDDDQVIDPSILAAACIPWHLPDTVEEVWNEGEWYILVFVVANAGTFMIRSEVGKSRLWSPLLYTCSCPSRAVGSA